jgi:hypothetical protein
MPCEAQNRLSISISAAAPAVFIQRAIETSHSSGIAEHGLISRLQIRMQTIKHLLWQSGMGAFH